MFVRKNGLFYGRYFESLLEADRRRESPLIEELSNHEIQLNVEVLSINLRVTFISHAHKFEFTILEFFGFLIFHCTVNEACLFRTRSH